MSEKDNWDKFAIIMQCVIAFGYFCLLVYIVGAWGFNWW